MALIVLQMFPREMGHNNNNNRLIGLQLSFVYLSYFGNKYHSLILRSIVFGSKYSSIH